MGAHVHAPVVRARRHEAAAAPIQPPGGARTMRLLGSALRYGTSDGDCAPGVCGCARPDCRATQGPSPRLADAVPAVAAASRLRRRTPGRRRNAPLIKPQRCDRGPKA
eukprot:3884885-Prymnesium_polylepis.2